MRYYSPVQPRLYRRILMKITY
ncbi:hypothetical protein G3495_10715 [Shewanella baltica]|nr:hypothetical protein [Shewanella baltica]MCS6259806.1 hypothetical protein [Shewanella baltica]MCS6270245.1 hypothetical protein [Shewanella baltica]